MSLLAAVATMVGLMAGPAGAAPSIGSGPTSNINGQGSTYAALAFQQWTQSVQTQGLNVNYTSTGSPAGLVAYQQGTADFAGTEAEFSEEPAPNPARGFEYTPDVAGATAIMYHVALHADGSDPVNYLHLDPLTIAKIFLGVITNWDDPAISADNHGLVLPDEPITINFRGGQSGTTALFMDFVKQTDPTDFAKWLAASECAPANGSRIWELDDCVNYQGPTFTPEQGSDEQAEALAAPSGLWSIGYDEFGYARVYGDNVAWVENAAGNWVQPYAQNIAAALQSAQLAADTSQNLDNVYTSTNPLAYPISAYSYILVQCAKGQQTCATPYSSQGIADTVAQFMMYIACDGQVAMSQIGYSPLPVNLAQSLANEAGGVLGQAPVTLNAANCDDPTFTGSLGEGSVNPNTDPYLGVGQLGTGSTPTSSAGTTAPSSQSSAGTTAPSSQSSAGTTEVTGTNASSNTTNPNGPTNTADIGNTAIGGNSAGSSSTNSGPAPVGLATNSKTATAVGGGSGTWRTASPVAYQGPVDHHPSPWLLLGLLLLLVIPVAALSVRRRTRSNRGEHGTS